MRACRLVCVVVAIVLLGLHAQAIGTVTVTTVLRPDVRAARYSLAWVSDAAGTVSGNPQTFRGGALIQVKFIPDGGGTVPTSLYDLVLNDTNGVDYLAGAGANLSATVSTILKVPAPLLYDGLSTLDLVVTNAGAAKGGTVQLWFQQ